MFASINWKGSIVIVMFRVIGFFVFIAGVFVSDFALIGKMIGGMIVLIVWLILEHWRNEWHK